MSELKIPSITCIDQQEEVGKPGGTTGEIYFVSDNQGSNETYVSGTMKLLSEDPLKLMIRAQVDAALWDCCPPEVIWIVQMAPWLQKVFRQCEEDAVAFANKDPAARGKPESVIASYTSFKAVLHYRLANALLSAETLPECTSNEPYALLLSSRGKILSGAELHPRCRIGRRFVLDHGVGTVFGETTEIGDDCYVLGGVTLGAIGIAGNLAGKRHPTVGHRVQIGAFARVFGTVSIGDDAFIGPHSVITEYVPACCVVNVRTSNQVTRTRVPRTEPSLNLIESAN